MTRPASADEAPALVLVVDDNPASRYLIGTWLTRAGHTVIEAADGTEALALLAADRTDQADLPELAVVDVRLPDMSGFEVCERIKADPRTAGLPVIHISATAVATADRTQGLDRGADAYLTEPIAPSELVSTVAAVMRYARARSRAERLASHLATLNQATLDVYAAQDGLSFRMAAAAGAAALVQGTAVVIAHSADSESVYADTASPDGPTTSDTVTLGLLDRLTRGLPDKVGMGTCEVSAETRSAPALERLRAGKLALFTARTQRTRPAFCIAVGADSLRAAEDARLLTQFAQACALALEALRSFSEEHELVLTLQRAFLPDLPDLPGVDMAVRYLPAATGSEIGGDFYEAVDTPDGLILAVGDVAGHSLQAAIVMGELRHALRVYAIEGHGLKALLEHLDNVMCRERPGWTATLCLLRLEPGTGRLEVANAGHLPPLLLDPGGGSRFVTEHGPLLGTGVPIRWGSHYVDIAAETRILMVTDGLIEVRGVDLADSLQQLRAAAVAGPASPGALCDHLLEVFGRDHDDDVVILGARVGDFGSQGVSPFETAAPGQPAVDAATLTSGGPVQPGRHFQHGMPSNSTP
ncbi:hypothetical protein GCM10009839_01730 [Catenulispora yoronensis]|uniref:Response regulatory domain-containing protein n=1 Tax=Catenulispora yoronensis TaxID=450799 RepID=A0ABN2TJD1_9ACTN